MQNVNLASSPDLRNQINLVSYKMLRFLGTSKRHFSADQGSKAQNWSLLVTMLLLYNILKNVNQVL